jgi:hypothetical protein
MRDIHSGLSVATLIEAATLSADNTPPAVDLLGYNAAEIVLLIGVGGITFSGTNKIEFKLTHSDDNSTYTDVTAADMLGGQAVATGGIIKSLVAAHAAASSYRYGRFQRHARDRHADRRGSAARPRQRAARGRSGLIVTRAGFTPGPVPFPIT